MYTRTQAGERRHGKSKFLVPGWGPRVPLFQLCVASTRVEEFILKSLRTIVIFEFLRGLGSLLQLSSWNLCFFFNFRVSLSLLLVYFDPKVKENFLRIRIERSLFVDVWGSNKRRVMDLCKNVNEIIYIPFCQYDKSLMRILNSS